MFFILSFCLFFTHVHAYSETVQLMYPAAHSWLIQTQHELCPQKKISITFKVGTEWQAFALERVIYVPQDAVTTLEKLSTKNNLSFQEKLQLQKYKGLLCHELGHILYDNDLVGLAIMLSTSAFLIYCTSYIVQNTALLMQLFAFTLTGATTLFATDFLRKQYKETRADNFVINTKNFDAIEGLYKQFENTYQTDLSTACNKVANQKNNIFSKMYYQLCGWICAQSWVPENIKYVLWDQDHPSHQSRIDKLKQALKNI